MFEVERFSVLFSSLEEGLAWRGLQRPEKRVVITKYGGDHDLVSHGRTLASQLTQSVLIRPYGPPDKPREAVRAIFKVRDIIVHDFARSESRMPRMTALRCQKEVTSDGTFPPFIAGCIDRGRTQRVSSCPCGPVVPWGE